MGPHALGFLDYSFVIRFRLNQAADRNFIPVPIPITKYLNVNMATLEPEFIDKAEPISNLIDRVKAVVNAISMCRQIQSDLRNQEPF